MKSYSFLQVVLLIPVSHNLVVDVASAFHFRRAIDVIVIHVTQEKLVKLITVRHYVPYLKLYFMYTLVYQIPREKIMFL